MVEKSKQQVLVVNSHITWGGLGQFTLSLVKGLKNEGFEVDGLITHSNEDNFETFRELTRTTTYVGSFNKLKKYLAVLWQIWKTKPDVIIINYNAVIHFLLPFIPKSIVISIIHNDVDDFYRISKINHKYVDKWVAPTPGIKKGFIEYANLERADSETIVISHGISQSKIPHKAPNENELRLAFVGAVYEHKGADLLPEIMEKILTTIPYAQLQIIGTGKLESSLKNEFKLKGISENITFMGVIPHEQVRETLANSDILLFPTRVEAFGLVIAEAMMEGAIPLVTHLRGITDATVQDKETGYLVQKDDVNTFVQRVIELGNNEELLQEMSKKAKQRANEYLSLSTMSHNYKNLITRELNDAL